MCGSHSPSFGFLSEELIVCSGSGGVCGGGVFRVLLCHHLEWEPIGH